MLNYFKDNRSYIIIVSVIFLLLLFISYYFLKYNDEPIYFEVQKVKNEVSSNNEQIFRTTNRINSNLNSKKENKEESSTSESTMLFDISSEGGKYSIRFKSDKTLNTEKDIVKYISLTGSIIEESKTELFSLPLDENYIYLLNDIKIEIINNEIKKISSCAGNFLNTVLPEFSYYIQIDISNDSTHCYIKSQSEPKSSINHPLKDLKSDENFNSQSNMIIDEKELKELNISDKNDLSK